MARSESLRPPLNHLETRRAAAARKIPSEQIRRILNVIVTSLAHHWRGLESGRKRPIQRDKKLPEKRAWVYRGPDSCLFSPSIRCRKAVAKGMAAPAPDTAAMHAKLLKRMSGSNRANGRTILSVTIISGGHNG
jgi:hypothetical protein